MGLRVRLSPKTRRAQILRNAIVVIAEVGYDAATFSRIAARAGLSSTGLISYHFDHRDELMREVVAAVCQRAADYIYPRMNDAASPSAALSEFIVASVEFYAKFPEQVAALNAVRRHMRLPDGQPEFGPDMFEPEIVQLQQLMRRAQLLGEMTPFDTRVAAVSLRRVLDGAAREIQAGRADPAHYAAEVVRMFAAGTGQATRHDPESSGRGQQPRSCDE